MDKIFESRFMQKLQDLGGKISANKAISSLQASMMGIMAILLIGSISQILSMLGTMFNLFQPNDFVYNVIYAPYNLTMGVVAIWVAFLIGYNYSKALGMNPIQNGMISLTSFLLTCAPISTYVLEGGATVAAMDVAYIGSTGMFVAIIVGFVTTRISYFINKRNLYIKMPDVVPSFLADSFKAVVPLLMNVIIFQAIATTITVLSEGALSLPSAIISLLAVPLNGLNSVPGMFIIALVACLLWCFGIHGSAVVVSVVMGLLIQSIGANAAAVAAGEAPVFYPVLLYGMIPFCGGTGNTMGMVILGLRAKSQQIKSVSKVGLIPGVFGVNEPVLFGMPIMYNPILCIPFILCPLVIMAIGYVGYMTGILTPTFVAVLSAMPMGVGEFMGTLNIMNGLFPWLMIIVSALIYYPFLKLYDNKLYAEEQAKLKEGDLSNE